MVSSPCTESTETNPKKRTQHKGTAQGIFPTAIRLVAIVNFRVNDAQTFNITLIYELK